MSTRTGITDRPEKAPRARRPLFAPQSTLTAEHAGPRRLRDDDDLGAHGDLAEQIAAGTELADARVAALVHALQTLVAPNGVIRSGTVQIPTTSGPATITLRRPMRSFELVNQGTGVMTISAGEGGSDSAPGRGAGVFKVKPGGELIANVEAAALTVYGNPGDLFRLQCFAHPLAPAHSDGTASGTPAVTRVASSGASVALIAANALRRGVAIYNDSTANLFALLGTANAGLAGAGPFTVKIGAGGYYETPFGYTGAIQGIWDAVNGAAQVTELS